MQLPTYRKRWSIVIKKEAMAKAAEAIRSLVGDVAKLKADLKVIIEFIKTIK